MNIKVHIIAPYESMLPVIKECLSLFPELDITYSIGDLIKGVEVAILEEEKGADVIISRGGTAQLIKKAVQIPVIDMHLSGYDMIRSLTLASTLKDKTAIVGFSNITSGAQSIIHLLDLPLTVFTVSDSEDVAPLIVKLKNLGYKQIVGDVITIKTANAYGLRSFLIQSGKESIINSLEEAKHLYGYLHTKHTLTHIFEQFILKDTNNLMVLDDNNQIIYEHLTDFSTSPLSEDDLHFLNTDLATNRNRIMKNFTIDDCSYDVTGYYYNLDHRPYKIYVLNKNNVLEQKGLIIQRNVMSGPIAATSTSISRILHHIKLLYKNNELIVLQGDKGTGKNFITNYIHKEFADDGTLLTIDLKDFNLNDLESLPLSKVSTVKLKHISYIKDSEKLIQLITLCKNNKIRLFIISESSLDKDVIQGIKMNKIILPNLSERKEDINQLTLFFLSYYHQNYGTSAIKIKSDALKLVEEYTYPNNIDDLKNVIKQIALNEKDYVIQKETIQNVISNKDSSFSMKGTLKEIEKEVIQMVLKEENNNQTKAAERLGINRATLWRKLKE
ncbi:PrpR N-terminal domain-containing protein [Peribacillus loiseleuriae]|uniref:PrpR N-terminal domain-containing protein n=1 Tax=Peribacillus loiseleuriae TaxID=1679170 RepID=UPI003803B19D